VANAAKYLKSLDFMHLFPACDAPFRVTKWTLAREWPG
jgi:hypothetical protein